MKSKIIAKLLKTASPNDLTSAVEILTLLFLSDLHKKSRSGLKESQSLKNK